MEFGYLLDEDGRIYTTNNTANAQALYFNAFRWKPDREAREEWYGEWSVKYNPVSPSIYLQPDEIRKTIVDFMGSAHHLTNYIELQQWGTTLHWITLGDVCNSVENQSSEY
jgi:hypothetical protein